MQTIEHVCGEPLAVLGEQLEPLTTAPERLAVSTDTALSTLSRETHHDH